MVRKSLLILMALALVIPAWAFDITGGSGTVDIELTIGSAAVVEWQNTSIVFSDDVGSPNGDFYRPFGLPNGVRGVYLYGPATTWPETWEKASTDPFANGYYESLDGAWIWYQGNDDVDMTIDPGGDLTCGSATLPTWYTMAASGFWDDGFYFDNGYITSGPIPLDGQGVYAYPDGASGFQWSTDATYHYTEQWPFPMDDATRTITLPGVTTGNIKWLARVERNSDYPNVIDPMGTYVTEFDITFTETP